MTPFGGLALLAVIGAFGCQRKPLENTESVDGSFTRKEIAKILELSPLPPAPPSVTNRFHDNPRAARLGRFLFFDSRLSGNGAVSCASCHPPDAEFADRTPLSSGIGMTTRNAPSLWNTAYQRWFFWDGRADSLWSQALKPIEHPKEMGMTRTRLARLVLTDADLRRAYEEALEPLPPLDASSWPSDARPDPDQPESDDHQAWLSLDATARHAIDRIFANLGKAIEAYERQLVSGNAPFDRFVSDLRGEIRDGRRALSPAAQRGLKIFVGKGNCTLCHTGPSFTDREFHNIGLSRGPNGDLDLGRFEGVPKVRSDPFNGKGNHSDDQSDRANTKIRFVAQKPNNLGEFKTPSLRNVAKTAPYMHYGRFTTLTEVVRFYSTLDQIPALGHREESLIPLRFTEEEIRDVIAFLESLTGQPIDPELMRAPETP